MDIPTGAGYCAPFIWAAGQGAGGLPGIPGADTAKPFGGVDMERQKQAGPGATAVG